MEDSERQIAAARELLKLFHTRKRIESIMSRYTSPRGECRFYDRSVLSHCLLDPHAAHLEDCEGRTFREGMLCEVIADLPVERRARVAFSSALDAMKLAQQQDPRTLSAFVSLFTDGYWELLAEGGIQNHEEITKEILELEALLAEYFADRRFDLRGKIKGVLERLTKEFMKHLKPPKRTQIEKSKE